MLFPELYFINGKLELVVKILKIVSNGITILEIG